MNPAWWTFGSLICCILAFGCRGTSEDLRSLNGHEQHEARFVSLNGVRLQYLDWGGAGDGPVLAFFAEPYPGAFLGPGTSAAQQQKVDEWLTKYARPFYESRIPKFRAALPQARIVTMEQTNHAALPFQRRDRIREEMRSFLSTLPPGSRQ